MPRATFRITRGRGESASFKDYATEVSEGMVVLDAVHQVQAESAPDLACRWNCKAGKCGSCSAEINGKPRLMCMTRLSDLDLSMPVIIEPLRAFPHVKDLVTDVSWNYRVKQRIKPFKPRRPDAPDGTWRMHSRTWTACRSSASASSASCARTSATCCATTTSTRSSPARATSCTRPRWRCTRWTWRTGSAIFGARTASGTATSRSAAPRSARNTSPSRTTRSSRSRSGWSTSSTIP